MGARFDVCIRGAGIVGQSLALLLARERLRVALVRSASATDTAHAGHSDVRAYALNARSRELLQSLRVWPELNQATPVLQMRVQGDAGGQLAFSAAAMGADALGWICDVPALEALLADAVKYQQQIECVDAPPPASLTVVCEGRASATRDEFGVDFDITPYEQRAVATRVLCERAHEQAACQWFGNEIGNGDIVALLPLDGPLGRQMAVVWSTASAEALQLQSLDEAAFCERLAQRCGHAFGSMQLAAPRATWPLQLARARRWCGPGWALAGDAAHTVHPLAGQGLNLGLADVVQLGTALREREYWREPGDLRVLRRYARARQGDVLAMGCVTDGLQRLFSAPGPLARQLRNSGLNHFDHSGWLKHRVAFEAMGL